MSPVSAVKRESVKSIKVTVTPPVAASMVCPLHAAFWFDDDWPIIQAKPFMLAGLYYTLSRLTPYSFCDVRPNMRNIIINSTAPQCVMQKHMSRRAKEHAL